MTRLRISGHGEAAKGNRGEPGHLYIEIQVEEHEWFERDRSDLLMALPISYVDLVLGTSVEISHIDGQNLKINIPAGSKPGDTISLRGRGLPSQRSRIGRGSVMVLLGDWAQSIVTLQGVAAAEAMETVGIIYKLHVLVGLTMLLVFPFTRLVHVISVPVKYFARNYQLVRQR